MAFCFDGKDRLCRIRGSLRKITWINVGDIVLIGLREYQDNMVLLSLKYTLEIELGLDQGLGFSWAQAFFDLPGVFLGLGFSGATGPGSGPCQ